MVKGRSLLAHLTLFVFTAIFTIRIVFGLSSLEKFIRIGTFVIIWYAMMAAIVAGYKSKKNAYAALTLLYSLNLLNLALMPSIMAYKPISFIFAILSSSIGIIVSALYTIKKKIRRIQFPLDLTGITDLLNDKKEEPIKEIILEEPSIEKTAENEKEVVSQIIKSKLRSIKKTFNPSRYMASKTGEKFHSPKCNWAKKINIKNLIWIDTIEDAELKGFKKCELCIKAID